MSTSIQKEYDIIIAGGGTAGCVIAGRLAKAQPDLQILVLEAGPPTQDLPQHTQPAQYPKHLSPQSNTIRFYAGSAPSPHLDDRVPIVPIGACLGGGSSVNWMMYTRGSRSDYDDWKSVYGNDGWDFESLKPLFDKCESYQVDPQDFNHGSSGPLHVSHGPVPKIAEQWLETATQLDKNRPLVPDLQDFKTIDAYAKWAQWVDSKTGKRQDVPHHYIFPLLSAGAKNLHILTGAKVHRIIFDGSRATGVEYSHDQTVRPDGETKPYLAVAKKLVVVSGGAFGSPAILERSGIGGSEVLKKADVKQVVDLPGVGENYQDHLTFGHLHHLDLPDLANDFLQDEEAVTKQLTEQWMKDGTGLLASNFIPCGGKLRPNAEELHAMGEPFRGVWKDYFERSPDKASIWVGLVNGVLLSPGVPRDLAAMAMILLYPASIGYVHIASSNPDVQPLFDPAYLSHPADVQQIIWAYKHQREIVRRMPAFRGEFAPSQPTFAEGSAAAVSSAKAPTPIDAPKIQYSEEDDKVIEKYIRGRVNTSWHSMGTCAMKPRDQQGVVDNRLDVYGVQGLKVADLSICPSNVGANTYSTALVIGEKAAVIIAEDLGIKNI